MPIHDWTRVRAGLFHDFHQSWSIRIKDALNRGILPKGVAALVEQRSGPFESDILAIEARSKQRPGEGNGSVATMSAPATTFVRRTNNEIYADRANRIVVKRHLNKVIAVIEIMSPGNKDGRTDSYAKVVEFLENGIHVLTVDLFLLEPDDPPESDRILISYVCNRKRTAFIEPVAVGQALPEMPLYLTNRMHVKVPLERTYQATWQASPEGMRQAVETGVMPETDVE